MEHKGDSLWGIEAVKYYERGITNGVGEHGLGLRIGLTCGLDGRPGSSCFQRLFPPRFARSQHIEADAPDNGG